VIEIYFVHKNEIFVVIVKGKEPTRCDKVSSFIASTCFGYPSSGVQLINSSNFSWTSFQCSYYMTPRREWGWIDCFYVWLTVHLELYLYNKPTWCTMFSLYCITTPVLVSGPTSGRRVCNAANGTCFTFKLIVGGPADSRLKSKTSTIIYSIYYVYIREERTNHRLHSFRNPV
jgi:hypothetical protein